MKQQHREGGSGVVSEATPLPAHTEHRYPFRLYSGRSVEECVAFMLEHGNMEFFMQWKAEHPNMVFDFQHSTGDDHSGQGDK